MNIAVQHRRFVGVANQLRNPLTLVWRSDLKISTKERETMRIVGDEILFDDCEGDLRSRCVESFDWLVSLTASIASMEAVQQRAANQCGDMVKEIDEILTQQGVSVDKGKGFRWDWEKRHWKIVDMPQEMETDCESEGD